MKNRSRRGGFTTLELLIVLAIILTLSGFSFSYTTHLARQEAYNMRVLQLMVDDAVAGYFGMVGDYPAMTKPLVGVRDHELSEVEGLQLIGTLGYAAGYAILPDKELSRYRLVLTYPNEYIYSIKVIRK